MSWKATDYFRDQSAIELCTAIEREDYPGILSLLQDGVDVNATGTGGMTPLLWAFPDDKPRRFAMLLRADANPNVLVSDDFGTNQSIKPGVAVTHLAFASRFDEHYRLVMQHGGDANLHAKSKYLDEYPLHFAIRGSGTDKVARVKLLAESGADLDALGRGLTPAVTAVSWGHQFEVALALLEAGADPFAYQHDQLQQLAHFLTPMLEKRGNMADSTRLQFDELIDYCTESGVDFDAAGRDVARWNEMPGDAAERKRQRDQEIKRRKEQRKE